ncbi:ribosome biogenesis GTPase YlqF [Fodinisporobacter ferrooxydans]|uniref:Ribosome biogenesis GTPase A n=1 Tax=Fodinisporobacter ferrooxydans TaxID=2901836 RepID=A0ABY4CFN6_9BACL|nr:ribosome biogenesis GTPase YlqF [Alicyclobacillaceae bacterium MYW30-H2]
MTIQWFPGHMAKARREITEKLKLIDVVIELVDARLPLSSRNPMLQEIIQQKPHLLVMTKVDLADETKTAEWVKYFQDSGLAVVMVNAEKGEGLQKISAQAKRLVQDKMQAMARKGIRPRAVRALILGIPNVGKSSLINRFAKKSIAKTGDKPGVTRMQQWIKVGKDFELLDTPGILWPKFDDPLVGFRLAASGAIKSDILNQEEVACFLLRWLQTHYRQQLFTRYKLDVIPEQEQDVLLRIAEKRGLLRAGGVVDGSAAAELILREYQTGMLGRISLEFAGDHGESRGEVSNPEAAGEVEGVIE